MRCKEPVERGRANRDWGGPRTRCLVAMAVPEGSLSLSVSLCLFLCLSLSLSLSPSQPTRLVQIHCPLCALSSWS